MKKLVLLITVLVMIFLTAACGKGAVTTSPDTTAQPKETSTEAPTTQDPTTVETVFNTAQIQAITLYGQYGQGEGNKVTDENLSAVIAWLETFVIDKEVDDQPLPPGTNTYRLEIEYRDGSVVKTGLDVVEINGRSYYVKHGDLPECFETVLSESIVTTEPKLVAVYPEQYEAVSVSSSSCKVGSYYDNASRYDAQKRIENTETVRGADMPTDLRESGLTASSSEADFIAHAKKYCTLT